MSLDLDLLAKGESRGVKMKITKMVKTPLKDAPPSKDESKVRIENISPSLAPSLNSSRDK